MRLFVRTFVLLFGGFVFLALGLDAIVGISQPVLEPGAAEGILRTFDEEGSVQETRLVVVDDHDDGTLWIQSGHHFRGWYHRLVRNPEVELVRNEETRAYWAVPLDTPETESRVKGLLKQRVGVFRFYLVRTLLLFADVKPVRLDPR